MSSRANWLVLLQKENGHYLVEVNSGLNINLSLPSMPKFKQPSKSRDRREHLFHITSVENNQVEDGPSVTKEQEEMIQLLGELEAEIIYTTCATIRISPETRVASLSNSVPE
ncbi:hypothetical protein GRJ2_002102500 [Grus japonensis]|uniref:Uncharacterized protein n=1 Tax=Grus japonensis TaxID=30415 RepID=A0ABC9XH23_GRUJA